MRKEIEKVMTLAKMVLPSAKEKTDNKMLIAMGAIPDTYEWLAFKMSMLEPDDYKGLMEWQEYIIDKAKEKVVALGIYEENNQFSLRKWLEKTYKERDFGFMVSLEIRPQIECADGFKMSVQASEGHYCSPRENLKDGQYESVEIGFPSEEEELLLEYAEDPDEPTQTVYVWTPVEVVEAVIKKHGGIKR